MISGLSLALFILIFAVLFSTSDFNSGYIKNIGGKLKHKLYFVFSKAISLSLYVIIMFASCFVFQVISNLIFTQNFYIEKPADFVKYVSVQIVLHIAISLRIMMVALILRSSLFSMIIAVLVSSGTPALIYELLNVLIHEMCNIEVDLTKYSVVFRIMAETKPLHSIILALCYITFSMVASCLFFQRRDMA